MAIRVDHDAGTVAMADDLCCAGVPTIERGGWPEFQTAVVRVVGVGGRNASTPARHHLLAMGLPFTFTDSPR
jgi:hypothetical protein